EPSARGRPGRPGAPPGGAAPRPGPRVRAPGPLVSAATDRPITWPVRTRYGLSNSRGRHPEQVRSPVACRHRPLSHAVRPHHDFADGRLSAAAIRILTENRRVEWPRAAA